jgi:hypothetical protein
MKRTKLAFEALEDRNYLSGLSYFNGAWAGRGTTAGGAQEVERLYYNHQPGHVILTERFPTHAPEVAGISRVNGTIYEHKMYPSGATYDATWNHVSPKQWQITGTYTSETGVSKPMNITLTIQGPNRYWLLREVDGQVVETGVRVRVR